jgi:sugar phosphate isomerase/epimerase
MKLLLFTKVLKGMSPQQIADVALRLGFNGLDLAVRPGHAVNPSNIEDVLFAAQELWKRAGLSLPLVTLEAGATDPVREDVERIFRACGNCGIPFIKLGYWIWNPERHYWDEVEAIRNALSKFEAMGKRYGVCTLVHTHSDEYYGVNASAAMHLVRGFDARHIGLYLDPAHLALDGEYLPMALDIARDYLKMIGVKNARYQRANGQRWARDWCALVDGIADWPQIIAALHQAGYDGFLSVHGEYSASEEPEIVLPLVEKDTAYLKNFVD